MTFEQIKNAARGIAKSYNLNGIAEDIDKCTIPHELRGWIVVLHETIEKWHGERPSAEATQGVLFNMQFLLAGMEPTPATSAT